ncbi:response regulator transcription factor [Serratia fonticola]|uniref:response regulator transcription factor n=1 Tax=Serratia fonticola TaxID=47917 RepID=UPI0021792B58|nr:LuxR C-terminal-related transcriptional regulator [Serratia fonticola]CAI1935381.1 two component system sensor kinase SsrB [Serratia fonticola]
MTPILQVLINDLDQFFSTGLEKLLTEHFLAKGITLRFSNNPLSYPMADLIFWTPDNTNYRLPSGLLTEQCLTSRLIIVTSGEKNFRFNRLIQRRFNRHQSCAALLALVDEAISKKASYSHEELAAIENPMALLTPRQKEVMYYVAKGMRASKIANNMQLHEKTVSGHKRAAMGKLQLKRTSDLHNWLLHNPISRYTA